MAIIRKKCFLSFFVLIALSFNIPGIAISAQDRPLYFAVSAMISPVDTFTFYQDFIDYLSKRLGRTIFLKQRRTYQEVNELLRFGKIDFALICTGGYVEAREGFDPQLLVVPVIEGKPTYKSYIIVHHNSNITRFQDLDGKTFAFTDPLSNTGKLYPTYWIYKKGRTLDNFFNHYFYTYSHDRSIQAVAKGLVDAAAVDSLVYDYMKVIHPSIIQKTKIIHTSPAFGGPPMVASHSLKEDLKERILNIILTMHEDHKGKMVLNRLFIDRFISPGEDLYQSVFEMRQFLKMRKSR